MNTETRAKNLINNYYQPITVHLNVHNNSKEMWNHAKFCALILVNEIIVAIKFTNDSKNYVDQHNYWQSVKDAINIL